MLNTCATQFDGGGDGWHNHKQPRVRAIDEHWALMYSGRWGIHGVSLPGRATFSPGNLGFVTFGAPRPNQVRGGGEITIRFWVVTPSLPGLGRKEMFRVTFFVRSNVIGNTICFRVGSDLDCWYE